MKLSLIHIYVAQDERAELAPLRRFGREPRIDVLLRFRDRPLSLDDQADHAQALFLVRQAQKRAGMALGQVMLTQRLQNGRRMAQDAVSYTHLAEAGRADGW